MLKSLLFTGDRKGIISVMRYFIIVLLLPVYAKGSEGEKTCQDRADFKSEKSI